MDDKYKMQVNGHIVGFRGGMWFDPDKVDPELIQCATKEQAVWILEQLIAKLKDEDTIIFGIDYDIYPYDKEMNWRASGLRLNIAERNCIETDGHFTCDYNYGQYAREKDTDILKGVNK